ncbi:MAG: presqualene diphosphate synthase HpnD [Gammaproteobacteria bacterium]|nr:presqualene diphosphate synthase HpnD [Gammaproteobacteria bacterium]MDE0225853.1 presqualene diphosphate synthase HpnD [Gammaproteobacteria bacterium]MDE0451719.1 presqualene diphosphate synthase HpnD [Gammaproteobacteria bacterium]
MKAALDPSGNGPDPLLHVNRIVAQSSSSFLWGMRILPRERRRAMFAIYAFCREVDDIADEPGEVAEKRRALTGWREEIRRLYAGEPTRPTTRALLDPVRRFNLPQDEFFAVIDGMETDASPTVRMTTLEDLLRYCRNVAGAVGLLSIHAFGVPREPGPRIARALGNAFQLTNILRDLKEDAGLRRLYVPLDLLAKHGIATRSLEEVFVHPRFADVCAELAELARSHYDEADKLMKELQSRRMRPAAVMMAGYRETLEKLRARGWKRIDEPVRLKQTRKIWLAVRHGLL